jgi:glycosyltransferase involved in cell wall biosynthesis
MRMSKTERQVVIFDWGVSGSFGWGVYGLNLMLHWALQSDFEAVSARAVDPATVALSPLEWALVSPLFKASAAIADRRRQVKASSMNLPTLVLHALGNNMHYEPLDNIPVLGDPTIGIIFSEFTSFGPDALERARQYPLIVAGSRWNRDVLAASGMGPVASVMQGVDTTHFHPAPRRGLFRDKFVVFSGGKLERRKGQDLVVQAFRIFAQHHADAMLLTAWSSPWPWLANSLAENQAIVPIRFLNAQSADVWTWTRENGIPSTQVFHLGAVPHIHIPHVLREADVALCPNRAEGGTNLVAMECMACGIPVILSANTGHLDLIQERNCYPLLHQKPIDGADFREWGESDVDEMVAALEFAYANREDAAARGQRASGFISQFTWEKQMAQLADVLRPYARHSESAEAIHPGAR